MKFEQAVYIFETNALKFVNTVFRAKQKIFMFGTKIPYLRILYFNFEK